VAEEALATALYCYLIAPDEPVAVLGRGEYADRIAKPGQAWD
jgi:hypothetical protein